MDFPGLPFTPISVTPKSVRAQVTVLSIFAQLLYPPAPAAPVLPLWLLNSRGKVHQFGHRPPLTGWLEKPETARCSPSSWDR